MAKKKESSSVSVKVIADDGVTYARKDYRKGESIECTADQAIQLEKQGIVSLK